jgi:hypothetical protein
MSRNGSGVYSKPPGTTAAPGATITSSQFNSSIDDLVEDLNLARPIVAGGTGATTAATARAALGLSLHSDTLGTVSQTAGVPTGSVIERGNNSNGRYVRFADGTQICWKTSVTFTFQSAAVLGFSWTFPAAFVASGVDAFGAMPGGAGGDYTGVAFEDLGLVRANTITTTSALIWFHYAKGAPEFESGNEVRNCRVRAEGRWF